MKVIQADGKVTVKGVDRPKMYVRGRFNSDYAEQLAAVARDAMQGEGKGLDISKWPFTDPKRPILVRHQIRETKDSKTGKVTAEEFLTCLDGNHRMKAAEILKLEYVPGRVVECSDKEAALAQLQANVDQGLFLNRTARNEYILAMLKDKELKISQKEVAAITHLTPASINRILKGTQGKRSESSKRAGKAGKKARRGARVSTGFQTRVFFAELISVAGDFDKHSDVIEAASKGKAYKISKAFQEFVGDLKVSE